MQSESLVSWASKPFDCIGYEDKDGKNFFCPFFFPMSVLGTCCMFGRIQSLMEQEQPIVCEMGPQGFLCCIAHLFIDMPICAICFNAHMRSQMIKKHGIVEDNFCLMSVCYPCSLFQIYVTLKQIEKDRSLIDSKLNSSNP